MALSKSMKESERLLDDPDSNTLSRGALLDVLSIVLYLQCIYGRYRMKAQVRKWGNSLAVRIPKTFAVDLGVAQDSSVELSVEDGCLLIRPLVAPMYELEALLASVTPKNLHTETDLGSAMGKEAW